MSRVAIQLVLVITAAFVVATTSAVDAHADKSIEQPAVDLMPLQTPHLPSVSWMVAFAPQTGGKCTNSSGSVGVRSDPDVRA